MMWSTPSAGSGDRSRIFFGSKVQRSEFKGLGFAILGFKVLGFRVSEFQGLGLEGLEFKGSRFSDRSRILLGQRVQRSGFKGLGF